MLIVAAFAFFKTDILSGGGKLSNPIDFLSYSLGLVEGHYLQQRFENIHMPALKKEIQRSSRYTSIEPPYQKVMFMHSRNNLKNNSYDEKGYADLFEKYRGISFQKCM